METERPIAFERENALGGSVKYFRRPLGAIVPLGAKSVLERRLERRGAVSGAAGALSVSQIPAEGWIVGLVALVAAVLVGAWFGGREAEAALYAGQSPTLAELRARFARIRRIFGGSKSGAFFPSYDFSLDPHEELDAAERALRDLAPPSRRSS
jgi:hypothetical protein